MKKPNEEVITFACVCGNTYSVSANKAGRSAECNSCGAKFRVPEKSTTARMAPTGDRQSGFVGSTRLKIALSALTVAVVFGAAIAIFAAVRNRNEDKNQARNKTNSANPNEANKQPDKKTIADQAPRDDIVAEEWIGVDGDGLNWRGFGKKKDGRKHGVWFEQRCATKENPVTRKQIALDRWQTVAYFTVDYLEGTKDGAAIFWSFKKDPAIITQYQNGKKEGIHWILRNAEVPNGLIFVFKDGVPGPNFDESVLTNENRAMFDSCAKKHDNKIQEFLSSAPRYGDWIRR